MIPPLTRSADTRPPIDAAWEDMPDSARGDVPEFDRLPAFRSRRVMPPAPPVPPANEFGPVLVGWLAAVALGLILAGFGIWIGVTLS